MHDLTNRKGLVLGGAENRPTAPLAWRDGIGFRILLEKTRHRKNYIVRWMLLGSIVLGSAGVAYTSARVPGYTASSELLVSNTTLQLSGPDAVVTQILVENSLIQSAMEMLRSSKVLERVIVRIGLERIETILPQSRGFRSVLSDWGLALPEDSSQAPQRQGILAKLRSNTSVKRIGASQIISVRARATTAEGAAILTNEIAGSFVQEQNDTNAVVTTSAALRERIKVLGPTARVISEAVPPATKDGPGRSLTLSLAAVAGAALGMIVGVVLTLFDRRVRDAGQLATATSVECFGYLPRVKAQRDARGLWMNRKSALHPSRFHQDIASILKSVVLRRARSAVLERSTSVPHVVGVTSCCHGEGKTTFAANWAGLMAADGLRVLFVDASGGAARGESRGLYQLLRDEVAPTDVIRAELRPNLHFLPSGRAIGNIDTQWRNLARTISAGGECVYDWVIIDLPALVTVADVRSAGQIVDDLLIVVEWGRTSDAPLEQALRALGPVRERVIGTVINKTPWNSFDARMLKEAQVARRASLEANERSSEREARA